MIDWLFPDKLKDLKDFEFADFRSGEALFGILIAWLFINGFFQEQEKVNSSLCEFVDLMISLGGMLFGYFNSSALCHSFLQEQ
jgi:hypothetical protein